MADDDAKARHNRLLGFQVPTKTVRRKHGPVGIILISRIRAGTGHAILSIRIDLAGDFHDAR